MTSPALFHARLEAARIWECRFMAYLQARGLHVIPAYAMDSGRKLSPSIYGPGGARYTLPDLLVFNDARATWFEVKFKSRTFRAPELGAWVTGLDDYLYRDYQQVQRITGFDVQLIFIHERENQIRQGPLNTIPGIHRTSRGKLCVWPFDGLKRLPVTPHELTVYDGGTDCDDIPF